jgi:cytochrome c peroxidase
MFKIRPIGLFALAGLWLFSSCLQDQELPEKSGYWTIPEGFPAPNYTFTQHRRDQAVFELGRQLFYDPVLSVDSTISCASCHLQAHAFSDTTALSRGVLDRTGIRNSPPLFNLAWHPHFMWDGGINHLDIMPVAPITDSAEMAIPFKKLLNRLQSNLVYQQTFKVVWNSDSITDQQFLWSLGQFMAGLISADSPYDQYRLGDTNAINAAQIRGMEIFSQHCASCHTPPLFTNYTFAHNGTYASGGDPGRARITQEANDVGKFKVPSLRNIALTGPYMHDGRFRSLSEVVEHYHTGIGTNPDVDDRLKGGIPLTAQQKNDLIAFLHALTDQTFIQNKAFGPPFDE